MNRRGVSELIWHQSSRRRLTSFDAKRILDYLARGLDVSLIADDQAEPHKVIEIREGGLGFTTMRQFFSHGGEVLDAHL